MRSVLHSQVHLSHTGPPSADGKWVGLSSQDGSAKEPRILSGLVLSCYRDPRVEWRDDVGGVWLFI